MITRLGREVSLAEETEAVHRIVAEAGTVPKRPAAFIAHRIGGVIQHEPIFAEARFVDLNEALRLLAHDADRQLLESAIVRLNSGAAAAEAGQ